MTFKVLILFLVPDMGAVDKMNSITSSCFFESERIWVLYCPYASFPMAFALQNKKEPDWGPRRWRDFLWRGCRPAGTPFFVLGWEILAWAVCAFVSPCAFEGWRGGGRFPRICGCAPLRRGGPGGEAEEGGGYWQRWQRPGLGLSGKLLSCDGDDEVKMADLSKYNPGP